MMIVRVHHKGEVRETSEAEWTATADAMLQELGGPWDAENGSKVERIADGFGEHAPGVCTDCLSTTPEPHNVDCPKRPPTLAETKPGEVHAESATRIEALHATLRDAGMQGVGRSRQLYDTGTRMLDEGHATQAARAKEHAEKKSLDACVAELVSAVESERRRDIVVSAADFASKLDMNGALTFDGYKVREQAIRGLVTRLKSPALGFFLGVRDRIGDASANLRAIERNTDAGRELVANGVDPDMLRRYIAADKAELLDMLQRECKRFGSVQLKLRARDGLKDAFACVSPDYAPADAPDALRDVVAQLPEDTRATFSYDPTSTAWELRASVFTSTPADEQAVGEPFEAYASFRSRDNGTRGYTSGGGILLIRCWNASTYEAHNATARRRHVGRILQDVPAMVQSAATALHILTTAWGTARADVIARPCTDAGALIPLEVAIPGFFRSMLTRRQGELVGVLPGRTEKHVKELAMVYPTERRDSKQIVRADFAQAFTRYIQTQPTPVRRDAEAAIGKWIVGNETVSYVEA